MRRRPRLLDTFQPAEILGENGYWQDEDMEIDRKRKLIIGALDPRHDDVDQESCPGIGTLSAKNRNPKCKSGFYVISYKNPRHLEQVGKFNEVPAGHTTSCIDGCKYVWTGGPARRDDLAYLGPFTPGARGDGRPIWVTDLRNPCEAEDVHAADRPGAQRRGRRTTRTTSTSTPRASRGCPAAAGCSDTRRAASGATRRSTRVRRAHPWDPVLVAGGGCRAARTVSPSRRPTSSTTPTARPTARSGPRACGRATSR